MIITCPSCSARYQLANSKVKEKGTKVRCPRCSHKFTVFPEKKPEPADAQTELFVRSQGVIKEPDEQTQKPLKKEVAQSDYETTPVRQTPQKPSPAEDDPFDQPTRAYNPQEMLKAASSESSSDQDSESQEESLSRNEEDEMNVAEAAIDSSDPEALAQAATPAPMKDPAKVEPTASEAEEPTEDPGQIRPFGDQTLFEIQKGGKRAKVKWLKKLAAVIVIGALGFALYSGIDRISFESWFDGSSQVAVLSIDRPLNWYRDEPQTYQDVLASIAGLPQEERALPLNQALLAEALVLHGLLTGQTAEVIQGLGFAGPVSFQGTPLGVFANSAWAIWENKLEVQTQLLASWPENLRQHPEFGLLEFMTLARTKQVEEALQKAQQVVNEHPDFQRANNYAYYLSLKFASESRRILPENFQDQLQQSYERHLGNLQRQIPKLPEFYQQIERLRSQQRVGDSESKKKEAVLTEPIVAAREPEPVEEEPEAPVKKDPPPNVAELARASPAGGQPRTSRSGLPLASSELMASRSEADSNRSRALQLLEQGNRQAQQGNDTEALNSYREAIRLDSSLPEAYKRIGMLYMRQQDSPKARTAFQLYLRLNPGSSDRQVVEGWISSLE